MLAPLKKNWYQILLLCCLFLFFSCDTQKKETIQTPTNQQILQADMAFSDMSRQVGMKKAFLQYIEDEGTLLRPDHMPVVGAEAIDMLSVLSDTDYTLSWTPMKAEIARSGDLGYSYGIYELILPDTTLRGTYVNIWKKQNNGEWKFVLNSNNAGLE
jgi:ketosteroid isomerase-like protein